MSSPLRPIIFALLALTVIPANSVHAQSISVCAQVIPCDENNNILREYDDPSSPCYNDYLTACENQAANQLAAKFKVCEDNGQKYQQKIAELERKLEKLTRKSRASKRQ